MAETEADISTEWRRFAELSAPALYELLRFRQQIFVVEQRSAYPDLDGLDQDAWHLLLRCEDGAIAACLRVVVARAAIRIGRVAVGSRLRRNGLGRRMVTEALAFCRERDSAAPIILSAQLYLVDFYRSFGFATTGAPYDEHGLMHVDMRLDGNGPGNRNGGRKAAV